MDGRGRLAQSLKRSRDRPESSRRRPRGRRAQRAGIDPSTWLGRLQKRFDLVFRLGRPGIGLAATLCLILASAIYGMALGGHVPVVVTQLKDARDAIANVAGFRIAAVALTGNKNVTREEILATAGVTARASLLFLDADAARARLQANPWIADATVL
jgi:cell division protein FtsQ